MTMEAASVLAAGRPFLNQTKSEHGSLPVTPYVFLSECAHEVFCNGYFVKYSETEEEDKSGRQRKSSIIRTSVCSVFLFVAKHIPR